MEWDTRPKALKILEVNKGGKVLEICLGNYFFIRHQKQSQQKKNKKSGITSN